MTHKSGTLHHCVRGHGEYVCFYARISDKLRWLAGIFPCSIRITVHLQISSFIVHLPAIPILIFDPVCSQILTLSNRSKAVASSAHPRKLRLEIENHDVQRPGSCHIWPPIISLSGGRKPRYWRVVIWIDTLKHDSDI